MNHLFTDAGMRALMRFASAGTLLGLDYDGTLTRICPDPGAAVLSRPTHSRLKEVAALYPTVIITGRDSEDARRLIGEIPGIELVGNHGAEEPGHDTLAYEQLVKEWRHRLNERLEPLQGLAIEDKRISLSIHYRACRSWILARSVILDAVAGLRDARVMGGKAVINLVPQAAPHKGDALLAACSRWACSHAIYVGDDETDEDVFRLQGSQHILGVRIGRRRRSSAEWFLSSPAELAEMLALLVRCRVQRPPREQNPKGWGWLH